MTQYKTATHQNLAVWCRRLGMEIQDLDKGAAIADSIYGGPSRRGVFYTIAMKGLRDEVDPFYTVEYRKFVAAAMSNALYAKVVGGDTTESLRVLFVDHLMALVGKTIAGVTLGDLRALSLAGAYTDSAEHWLYIGLAARQSDKNGSSSRLANIILAKARG